MDLMIIDGFRCKADLCKSTNVRGGDSIQIQPYAASGFEQEKKWKVRYVTIYDVDYIMVQCTGLGKAMQRCWL